MPCFIVMFLLKNDYLSLCSFRKAVFVVPSMS